MYFYVRVNGRLWPQPYGSMTEANEAAMDWARRNNCPPNFEVVSDMDLEWEEDQKKPCPINFSNNSWTTNLIIILVLIILALCSK